MSEQQEEAKPLTASERREVLAWVDKRKRFFRWAYFAPYPRQREFLELGASKRERLLMAGNRLGKTECGAFEVACHATGRYPPWWQGRRFEQPVKVWVAGPTSLEVRDVAQTKLCGEPGVAEAWGAGMLPREDLIDKSLARGITDAYDTVQVKHQSGGVSIIRFKSYEQGRQKFQGESLDVVWFDEEPPLDIYAEGLTRLGDRDGLAMLTFTPLEGPTAVVLRYMQEANDHRGMVTMTMDDVPEGGHLSKAAKEKMLAGYLPHEREARARGVPMLGSGRIFQTPEAAIIEPPLMHIPSYWPKLWGIDIGIGHPFAAVLILWDKDNDVVHVHHAFRMSDAIPIMHVARMKPIGAEVPVAWPKDAGDRDHGTGEPVAALYRREGLKMLPRHASWPDGSLSTEAGLLEWDEREKTGRLKVAAQLSDWLEERRLYHRKNGQVVKQRDDLMSATRIALMDKRFARLVPLGFVAGKKPPERETSDDWDIFTGEPIEALA